MKTEVITYQYEDKDYLGYVAYPEKDLAPLVLMLIPGLVEILL